MRSVELTAAEKPVGFGSELFEFLDELRANNQREWFTANKHRYEAYARRPMLRFIEKLAERLPEVSEHVEADARPVGGSMFRIHRDTRFSRDKSPYKTNVAAHFPHAAARQVHSPGFYLHLEPGRCLGGGGIWHPDPASLAKVRDRIVAHPGAWADVLASGLDLEGDRLKRAPAGYAADHPHIEDLKRKDFFAMTSFSAADVCVGDFVDRYLEVCRDVAPLVRFLTAALDLPF
jgi:uncharacterized protein (TIGR02453 family)